MKEDEMAGWHHQLNGHKSEKIPGNNEGQVSLVCCSPWGTKESDTTERPNNKIKKLEGPGDGFSFAESLQESSAWSLTQ